MHIKLLCQGNNTGVMASQEEIISMESAFKEDLDALQENHKELHSIREFLETFHGITENSGKSIAELSTRFYHEYLILDAILEAFVYKDTYRFSELNKWVYSYGDKKFYSDVSVPFYEACIWKLCSLGFVKMVSEKDVPDPEFILTDEGLKALQNQVFSNLAQSTLYNYQASKANEKSIELANQSVEINHRIKKLTRIALFIAVCSALLTFFSCIIGLLSLVFQ